MIYKLLSSKNRLEKRPVSSAGPSFSLSTIKLVLILFITLCTTAVYSQTNKDQADDFRLAQSFEQSGQLEKAEEIYRDLLKRNSSYYQYFESLNKVLVNQKKYSESIDLIQNRIKQTPQDINLYGLLGSTYYMMD